MRVWRAFVYARATWVRTDVERASVDEAYLDVTERVNAEFQQREERGGESYSSLLR